MAEHGTWARYNHGQCRCEACKAAAAAKQGAYYKANREKVIEHVRIWQRANREKVRDYKRKWHETNNPDYAREYNAAFPEKNRERARAHSQANPGRDSAKSRAYREKLKALNANATRFGMPFESWEDAEILRAGVRLIDVAAALGRTYDSVKGRRGLLRRKASGEASGS